MKMKHHDRLPISWQAFHLPTGSDISSISVPSSKPIENASLTAEEIVILEELKSRQLSHIALRVLMIELGLTPGTWSIIEDRVWTVSPD